MQTAVYAIIYAQLGLGIYSLLLTVTLHKPFLAKYHVVQKLCLFDMLLFGLSIGIGSFLTVSYADTDLAAIGQELLDYFGL